jgi:tellurite resistance protein TerC
MQFGLSFFYIIIQVIFLEGILSIDNAAVLGAMVSVLPKQDRIPWPGFLKFLGPPVHRLLGGQRSSALKVGLLGAYVGRGLMLVLANFVVHNPYLKILGAGYLIRLGFSNLGEPEPGEEDQVRAKRMEGRSFWSVVIAVELADLAFSLDNVVAVVALSDNLPIVMFGVFVGIVAMRFAASIFTWLVLREPILKPAAYLVVFNIGAELLMEELWGISISGSLKFVISGGTLILFVVYAHFKPLHVFQPVFDWVAEGMANINEIIDWTLVPVILVIKIFFKGIGLGIRPIIALFRKKPGIVSQSGQMTFDFNFNNKEKEVVKP